MNKIKTNESVRDVVRNAVPWEVHRAEGRTVSESVSRSAYNVVFWPVSDAVDNAVYGAVQTPWWKLDEPDQ